MDGGVIIVVVHFNGSRTIIDESVIFMCDYPALVYLPDTIRGFTLCCMWGDKFLDRGQ